MRKAVLLAFVTLLVAGCGGGSMSAVATERYLKAEARVPEAHCLPGSGGWSYLCTIRRGTSVYRVGVRVAGKHVKETTGLLRADGALPPVPGSPEAAAQSFLDRASAICSRRMTIVAAIPHPQNVYAAYRLMGAYVTAEREQAESLRRLDPPKDKADGVRHLISASNRAVTAAETYRVALLHQDRRRVARALAARSAAAAAEQRAVQELGLSCAAATPS